MYVCMLAIHSDVACSILEDDVESVNDTGNVTENGQEDVDPEVTVVCIDIVRLPKRNRSQSRSSGECGEGLVRPSNGSMQP